MSALADELRRVVLSLVRQYGAVPLAHLIRTCDLSYTPREVKRAVNRLVEEGSVTLHSHVSPLPNSRQLSLVIEVVDARRLTQPATDKQASVG